MIDDARARKLASDLKRCSYYETCATYGLNVERVFQDGKIYVVISMIKCTDTRDMHTDTCNKHNRVHRKRKSTLFKCSVAAIGCMRAKKAEKPYFTSRNISYRETPFFELLQGGDLSFFGCSRLFILMKQ